MKTFKQKQEALADMHEKLGKAKVVIFTAFAKAGDKGLTVAEMSELRKQLRSVNAEYSVQKKTVLSKALSHKNLDIDLFSYEGSLAAVLGYGDGLSTIKNLYGFAKTHPSLRYLGGIFEDKSISKEDIMSLAKLPSREVLLSQFVGMLMHPLRSFAIVIDQIAKSKSN